MSSSLPSSAQRLAPLALMALLLFFASFFGGSSRADAASQALIRPVAMLIAVSAIMLPSENWLGSFRWPLALLGLLGALMLAQLIPLPPSVWTDLPSRELFALVGKTAGLVQSWRPISIAPDLTLNSLLALVVPLAGLIVFARLPRASWFPFLCIVLGVIGVSALFALGQLSGRMDELYLYRVTDRATAVGLFANRNHQALLLATALPLLATFVRWPIAPRGIDPRPIIAVLGVVFITPLILVTGSRAGVLSLIVGVALGWAILRSTVAQQRVSNRAGGGAPALLLGRNNRLLLWAAAGIALTGVLLGALLLARAEAIERLFASDLQAESRAEFIGPVVKLVSDYFPIGSGFGTFDPAFRIIEPFDHLGHQYLNHAHNDWIELVLEGGVPAVLLLLAFVAWSVRRGWRYWKRQAHPLGRSELLGRTGAALIVMLGLASVFDYPLRTPLLALLFAFASGFLCVEPKTCSTSRSAMDIVRATD